MRRALGVRRDRRRAGLDRHGRDAPRQAHRDRRGSGPFAIAVAHGQVNTPGALYAKLSGKVGDATVLVDCLVGTESTQITYHRPRAALFRFPVKPAGADICHVTATVSGRGKIVAELRAVR